MAPHLCPPQQQQFGLPLLLRLPSRCARLELGLRWAAPAAAPAAASARLAGPCKHWIPPPVPPCAPLHAVPDFCNGRQLRDYQVTSLWWNIANWGGERSSWV